MGLIVVKKEVWKAMQTTNKKRSASHTGKTVLGAVGPFKNKKTRHQNKTRQVDQTRPGVPKGTVADIN